MISEIIISYSKLKTFGRKFQKMETGHTAFELKSSYKGTAKHDVHRF